MNQQHRATSNVTEESTSNSSQGTADTTTETAIFRSVSMAAPPPPQLLSDSPPQTTFHKSHSTPIPANDRQPMDWVWKLDAPLSPLPMYHPLERTAVKITTLQLDTVTARVSTFMREQSITCSYHQGSVDCMTEGLLKFAVQLWQDNDAIIMEVQRRSGCCIQMQGVRHHLIQAVVSSQPTTPSQTTSGHQSKTSCEFLEQLVDATAKVPMPPRNQNQGCLPSALSICKRLLASPRLDEKRLGLESLTMVTDPSKVVTRDAERASIVVLSDPSFQQLLEPFFVDMKLAQHHHLGGSDMMDEDDDDYDLMDYDQGEFYGCLHVLALQALSNALDLVVWNEKASQASMDLQSSFWQTILQALYYNLKNASHRPLEASLSIKCLRLLQTREPSTMNMAPSQRRLHEYLLDAHLYGREHSRKLEQETEQLMGRLGFVH